MKHTLFILALITASIHTFAQSPRIKLNQITKDSLTGSVLISSPTDSGMVYSRDLFISYGADTVLILGGDTLAATSSIISSVLSDGVTITGDGTTGSELTVDTATVIATKQDLDLYYLDSNPDGYTSNTGTVTSVGGTGTVNGISLSGTVTSSGNLTLGGTLSNVNLASQVTGTLPIANGGTGSATQNFVDLSTTQMVNGAKTFTSSIGSYGILLNAISNSPFPNSGWIRGAASTGVFIVNNALNRYIGIKTDNTLAFNGISNFSGGNATFSDDVLISTGDVGIGTLTPGEKLEVNGKVKISDLTGTGGNAVYENGGVLGVASDARFKNYIGDIDNGIQKVLNLKPKYFIDNRNSAFQQLGFYAQEVKSIINEASYPIGNTDYLGINDRAIIAVTVKAIQEQQAIIETQATEIDQLKQLITELSNRLTILENN